MLGGRKVAALKKLQSLSLVSCKHMIEGAADRIASRTIVHFSGSPRPRTFQENSKKAFEEDNILIKNTPIQMPLTKAQVGHSRDTLLRTQ